MTDGVAAVTVRKRSVWGVPLQLRVRVERVCRRERATVYFGRTLSDIIVFFVVRERIFCYSYSCYRALQSVHKLKTD